MVETLAADVHPPYLYPAYRSTQLRAPSQPPVRVAPSPLEAVGPMFPKHFVKDSEVDLTTWGKSAPLGEKMVLVGRVLDEDSRPVRRSLIEVWQANASGKYPHPVDDHEAPLDPNFLGKGQLLTDDEGRYRIVTVKPGAYPWQNHAFGCGPRTSISRSSGTRTPSGSSRKCSSPATPCWPSIRSSTVFPRPDASF